LLGCITYHITIKTVYLSVVGLWYNFPINRNEIKYDLLSNIAYEIDFKKAIELIPYGTLCFKLLLLYIFINYLSNQNVFFLFLRYYTLLGST